MTGKKFHKLLVISENPVRHKTKIQWDCVCDCGNTCIKQGFALRSGATKSCGCDRGQHLITHGYFLDKEVMSKKKKRFHNVWKSIKQRTTDVRATQYKNYGGRGITACERWLDFSNFKDDMYEGYNRHCERNGYRKTVLVRHDIDGNFNPENCRWATPKDVKKKNHNLLTHNGETKTVSSWAKSLGIQRACIYARLRAGHTIEDALDPSFKGRRMESESYKEKKRVVVENIENLSRLNRRTQSIVRYRFGLGGEQSMTLEEISKLFGISRERVRQIVEKALITIWD